MNHGKLKQLATETIEALRVLKDAFAPARAYVQDDVVARVEEALSYHRDSTPDDEFDDAVEDLSFDLIDAAGRLHPNASDDDWDVIHKRIDRLRKDLFSRREEIVMAAQEEIADSKRR